jgi:hypothetical protein
MVRWLALSATLLLVMGCDKPKEPEKSDSRPPLPQTADKPSPASRPTEVAWDAPPLFQKADNPSPMRKATYKVARAEGDAEDAELTVSQAGGSIDQNIVRWAGQFGKKLEDVKRERRTVNGLEVTVVEIHGTYAGMAMPGAAPSGGPKQGFALLGAIVETSPPTFFKLTGPEKTVTSAHGDFDKLVNGLRSK